VTRPDLALSLQLLVDAMSMMMVMANVPYMSEVVRYLPNPVRDFEEWIEQTLEERKRRGTEVPDVFGFLLNEDKQSGWKHTPQELISDAMLMVIAGSDTSSVVMCLCIYHIISYKGVMEKLRHELDAVFHESDCNNFDKLGKECPYLNAIINETLRLYPPVASGLQRETPGDKGGLSLRVHGKNIVIPPNVIVTTPTLALQRDPRNFSPQPDEFRPQRWLKPEEETAFNRAAFNPFSYGPTSCIGKTLAFMEIRIVVASIVRNFDMTLEPGFDPVVFTNGFKDIFTTKLTRHLPVRLHPRTIKA
jgi:cytochrome P450